MSQNPESTPQTMPTSLAIHGLDWERLRLEFLHENLRPGITSPYTLRQLAEKYTISYGTLRNRAATEKWLEQLDEKAKEKQELATNAVRDLQVTNEVEVRLRQANFARVAQNKAMTKLMAVDANSLTVRESIELLRLGLIEERAALGMGDHFTPPPPENGKDPAEVEAVKLARAMVNRIERRAAISQDGERDGSTVN